MRFGKRKQKRALTAADQQRACLDLKHVPALTMAATSQAKRAFTID
ncbi:hypothetical protein PYH37_002930 [Sinorhizobium numidicum]|uniref:Transposase n=1 Tax=Sinorhizobium numidicum TaxID=680248 RepID=A0ABY8D1H4_9HYPH|nr:hypothetical protein [Sinorhizobium numidicum]WEX78080.1 hypothetical protein PYH37_002930 [Sinorhizobium numidicum]WEX84739.1 hypothetical protein PYH38_003643 [Sinorhizobium numidicum]